MLLLFVEKDSAKQAAGALVAIGVVVTAYVLARSLDAITDLVRSVDDE